MLYYFMSQIRSSAFTRSAIQFLRLVQESGASAILVTADGMATDSIMSNLPVLSRDTAVRRITAGDRIVADDPGFILSLQNCPATGYLHDRQLDALWEVDHRMKSFLPPRLMLGRAASAPFHYSGQVKSEDTVAVDIPSTDKRWGRCFNQFPALDYLDIGDGSHELEVADRLCRSSLCLIMEPRSSPQTYAEAMAAGTTLLVADHGKLPAVIQHTVNAWVVKPKKLVDAVAWMLQPEQAGLRHSLRHGALATVLRDSESGYQQQIREFIRHAPNRQVAA
jgi:glycosyltransferase involved in cell wall biosynthesis